MEKEKQESPAKGGFFGKIWNKFGEVAVHLGLASDSNVEKALAKQATDKLRRRLGETLVAAGKLTKDQVKEVLKIQKEWFRKATAKKPTAKAGKKTAAKATPVKKEPVKATATATKSPKKKPGKATAKKPTAKAGKKTVVKAKPAKKKPVKVTATKSSKKKPGKAAAKKPTAKAGKKAAA
jgi:hypothetical protein